MKCFEEGAMRLNENKVWLLQHTVKLQREPVIKATITST